MYVLLYRFENELIFFFGGLSLYIITRQKLRQQFRIDTLKESAAMHNIQCGSQKQ